MMRLCANRRIRISFPFFQAKGRLTVDRVLGCWKASGQEKPHFPFSNHLWCVYLGIGHQLPWTYNLCLMLLYWSSEHRKQMVSLLIYSPAYHFYLSQVHNWQLYYEAHFVRAHSLHLHLSTTPFGVNLYKICWVWLFLHVHSNSRSHTAPIPDVCITHVHMHTSNTVSMYSVADSHIPIHVTRLAASRTHVGKKLVSRVRKIRENRGWMCQ